MHPIERLRFVARAHGADPVLLVRETAAALASFGDDPSGLVTACRRIVARHPSSGPLWWFCSRVLAATDPMAEVWRAADEMGADRTDRELGHALAPDAVVCVATLTDQMRRGLERRGDVTVLRVGDSMGHGTTAAPYRRSGGLGFGAGDLMSQLLAGEAVRVIDVPPTGVGAAAANCDVVVIEAAAMGVDGLLGLPSSLAAAAVARQCATPVWAMAGVGRVLPDAIWTAVRDRCRSATPWDAELELVPVELIDEVVGPHGRSSVEVVVAAARRETPVAAELLRALPEI